MKNWFRNIGLLIMLLLAGQMSAQVPVLDSVCSGAVRHYRVDGEAGSTYSWILTPPAGPTVTMPSDADTLEMIWAYPAGIYELQAIQHALNGCDAELVSGLVYIFEQPEVSAGPDAQVCLGRAYSFADATAAYTSTLLWVTSGDGNFNDNTLLNPIYMPGPNDELAGVVILTLTGFGLVQDGGCDPSVSGMELYIVTVIVPQFDSIGPLCQYSVPPVLPDTSQNGITGTWTPPTIDTSVPGIFTFVFTPDNPDQCGVETTMDIAIVTEILPVFEPIGPLCQYSTPPALPDTSLNGITGTWAPPTIDTSVPGTFTFTFTVDPDLCGTDTTLEIIILPQVTPIFDTIGPLCQYSTPPALPGTSLNGITGTWNPAWISTVTPGTFTYTFTPGDPAQCATVVTMEIAILPVIIPEFEPIGPLCQHSTPPALPDTSLNGIGGFWTPPVIITDVAGTFNYTFTPTDPEPCVVEYNMEIIIMPEAIPTFDPIGPLCQNSIPPALPDTSLEGITGTWVPPTIDTSVPGTFTFTFTPDPGQCSAETSLEIAIVTEIIPEFEPIGPLCQNSAPPVLPDTSLNGITGTWVPPTIDTSVPGTFTFTFTPDPGQCSADTSLEIAIVTEIIPEFDPVGPLCQNSAAPVLPVISLNGITGTWDPSMIDTSIPGTFTYNFTPDNPDQCGVETSIEIAIVTEIIPEFDSIGPLCQNSQPPALPGTSPNGITGVWNPSFIDTSDPGTYTFTFTPDTGQCAIVATMSIEVTDEIIPVFDPIGPLSQNSTPPALPDTSLNGITGAWEPAFIDTSVPGTFTYTFTPAPGQCASVTDMEITVLFDYLFAITGAGGHCLTGAAIVPLEVDNFTSVATFQLKLSYNVDKLLCEGYINPQPQLADHITGLIDQVTGVITINWQDFVPVTFTGQTNVCELVFTPKEPGQGQLSWYTGPTESYFTNLEGLPIPAQFFTEQLEIYEPPSIILAGSKTVCEGDTVTIFGVATSTYPPVSYLWTYPDGSTQTTDPFFTGITRDDAGDYVLLVTDSLGCTDQKAIRLVVSDNPVADFHGDDTLTVPPDYILDAGPGFASYLWNTGETSEYITIDTTGWYWVEMESHVGCKGTDSIYILVHEIPPECLFIPNAFTPDGDGLNDIFKAVSGCPLSFFNMQIFNRWGEELFESEDISIGWDGKKNGVLCPGDAYVYKISYKPGNTMVAEKVLVKTGVVVIVK